MHRAPYCMAIIDSSFQSHDYLIKHRNYDSDRNPAQRWIELFPNDRDVQRDIESVPVQPDDDACSNDQAGDQTNASNADSGTGERRDPTGDNDDDEDYEIEVNQNEDQPQSSEAQSHQHDPSSSRRRRHGRRRRRRQRNNGA